ncbi:hypothetical protein MYBA111488_24730 [Mycobacterium basiliense]
MARLPICAKRACSTSSTTSIDDNNRPGSLVIATNTRRNRSINTSMLAASNTSVRNSTVPPIPAGSPASLHRSPTENVRSIRAVWVWMSNGVMLRSPRCSSAEASFCQASITWING